MNKVFIVNPSSDYVSMFVDQGWEVVGSLDEADFVQFTGGEDVDPSLYGHEKHHTTYSNLARDMYEKKIFEAAAASKKGLLGICRGGQFLNVMNGGTMYQHVDGHARMMGHRCTDEVTGEDYYVTSTHHQMMFPSPKGIVVATAREATKLEYYSKRDRQFLAWRSEDGERFEDDTEVVWYPDTKSLCFQPHPEFPRNFDTRKYYFELINRYFGV